LPSRRPEKLTLAHECHFIAQGPSARRQQTSPRHKAVDLGRAGGLLMNAPRIALAIARCSFASPSCWLVAALLVGQHALPASADPINDGKAAFSQCSTCHSITGAQDSGPHLNGVVGRKSGSVPNFNYSSAMKSTEVVWDTETLDRFLANPQQAVPGTRMPFSGLPDAAKRAALIAYLATLKEDANARTAAPAVPTAAGDGPVVVSSTPSAPEQPQKPVDAAANVKAPAPKPVKSAKKTQTPPIHIQPRYEVHAW
jgi:cytochrome c